jgi:hypothetical protein
MRDDRRPVGFECLCGNKIDFPAIVLKLWHKSFEAKCRRCDRVWKGAQGLMKLVGRANPRVDIWTPRGHA